MNDTSQGVTVEIYDQPYHLRGQDPAYIERLANLVDTKMRSVAAQGTTVDSLRVAVLAAINIADELMTLQARYRNANQAESTLRTQDEKQKWLTEKRSLLQDKINQYS